MLLCMRACAPPLPQPWSGIFDTLNYVRYQRASPGEVPDRVNAAAPNSCLVVATGTVLPQLLLGLGTVHPACRVSHFGFVNNDADEAWANTEWQSYNESQPQSADFAVNLNYRWTDVEPGGAVSFTWAYIVSVDYVDAAMAAMAAATVLQPSTCVGGAGAVFSVVTAQPVVGVVFSLLRGHEQRELGVVPAADAARLRGGNGTGDAGWLFQVCLAAAGVQ